MKYNNMIKHTFITAVCLWLVACGGGSGSTTGSNTPNTPPANGLNERVVDAKAGGIGAPSTDPNNKFTYFSFATGQVIDITDAAAATDTSWHIAFKRTSIKLNGGVSGTGGVQGAVANDQADFYQADGATPNASVFTNASAQMELNAINAVTSAAGLTYAQDRNVPAVNGGGISTDSWWSYNPANRTVSANPAAWSIVRGAGGNSYAKVHVTDIVQASRDITMEMLIQGPADMAFSTTPVSWTATIGAGGGTRCYDFDTTTEVDCTTEADNWDIQVEVTASGRSWNIWTNSGIRGNSRNGGAFGTLSATDAGGFASGGSVRFYTTDTSGGVFKDSSWYAYNLQGNNTLWPNYRVYVVDTGSQQYKMQITSYYDPVTGDSGVFSIRYDAL